MWSVWDDVSDELLLAVYRKAKKRIPQNATV
jgi:hypothetical protein